LTKNKVFCCWQQYFRVKIPTSLSFEKIPSQKLSFTDRP